MENFENPTIVAKTLSVLQNANDSITCYVEINDESCNITLRFDNETARIAGYPNSWKIWDEVIDGDPDARTYEDAFNDATIESFEHEIESIDAYVSRQSEKEIFKKLKESLKVQFEDEMFKDTLDTNQQEEVFQKIDQALNKLN